MKVTEKKVRKYKCTFGKCTCVISEQEIAGYTKKGKPYHMISKHGPPHIVESNGYCYLYAVVETENGCCSREREYQEYDEKVFRYCRCCGIPDYDDVEIAVNLSKGGDFICSECWNDCIEIVKDNIS